MGSMTLPSPPVVVGLDGWAGFPAVLPPFVVPVVVPPGVVPVEVVPGVVPPLVLPVVPLVLDVLPVLGVPVEGEPLVLLSVPVVPGWVVPLPGVPVFCGTSASNTRGAGKDAICVPLGLPVVPVPVAGVLPWPVAGVVLPDGVDVAPSWL